MFADSFLIIAGAATSLFILVLGCAAIEDAVRNKRG